MAEKENKKRRLSLSKKKPERFKFASSKEVDEYKQKHISKNTERTTQWAVKSFTDWMNARKKSGKDAPPANFLNKKQNPKELCKWLCIFFTEVRRSNGDEYCPRSLSGLLAGLQRHIETSTDQKLGMKDEEGEFKSLHVLLGNRYKELHDRGIGVVKAQADVVTLDEERILWDSGVMGEDNPKVFCRQCFIIMVSISLLEVGKNTEI